MANKNITDLVAATTTALTDLILGRIGSETEDRKIPISVLATLLRTTGLYGVAGQGPQIKSGTNARIGTGTLTAGTSGAIANTSVTATTKIDVSLVGSQTNGGAPIITKNAGVGFTVTSTNGLHGGNFEWSMTESI